MKHGFGLLIVIAFIGFFLVQASSVLAAVTYFATGTVINYYPTISGPLKVYTSTGTGRKVATSVDQYGKYTFYNLPAGTYIFAVLDTNTWDFTPNAQTKRIGDNTSNINFTAVKK